MTRMAVFSGAAVVGCPLLLYRIYVDIPDAVFYSAPTIARAIFVVALLVAVFGTIGGLIGSITALIIGDD